MGRFFAYWHNYTTSHKKRGNGANLTQGNTKHATTPRPQIFLYPCTLLHGKLYPFATILYNYLTINK